MHCSLHSYLFLFLLMSFTTTSLSLQTALLISITKEPYTPQYTTTVWQNISHKPSKLLIDLDASFLWINCQKKYTTSPSYHPIPCNSALCTSIATLTCSNIPPGSNCANETCALFPQHPLTRKPTIAIAFHDSIAFPTTNGRNPGRVALISDFPFACSQTRLLKGGVTGILALGQSNFSLSAQVSTAFSSSNLFTLCLSNSPSAPGVAFFGTSGPYVFLPGQIDLSKSLSYTPFLDNPPSDHGYFIAVHSIKVNKKILPWLNTSSSFLTTKISTLVPYTTLETAIYNALTEAFIKEANDSMHLVAVRNPVKPFRVCYSADDVDSTTTGPGVPTIDLVTDRDNNVAWRIYGSNSMVRIMKGEKDMWCLGFLDGGTDMKVAMVTGGHQMGDNLLQFDVGLKKFGFSSSVLAKGTSCANFNFTSNEL